MSYRAKDFDQMEFNPLALDPYQTIYEKHPRLGRRPVLCRMPKAIVEQVAEEDDEFPNLEEEKKEMARYNKWDVNNMVRFSLLFVCRLGNPIAAIRDFDERMDQCFDALALKKTDRVRVLIESNHWWFQSVMLEIFKMEHDMDYEAWFSQKMLFHQQTKLLRSNIGTGDVEGKSKARATISENLDKLREKIRSIEYTLFPDAKTASRIIDAATQEGLGQWAERYAMSFHDDPQLKLLENKE
jgi:hypothetical protein